MKQLFLCALFFTTTASFGANDIQLGCSSSVAMVNVWSDANEFHFRLDDAIGFQNFPIYDGVVTPSMTPLILRGNKDLVKFDGEVHLSWPRSKCQFSEKNPLLVECSGRGKIESPTGTDLTVTGMSTSIESIERIDMSYQRVKFNVGLDTPVQNYTHYFLAFPFAKEKCLARLNKLRRLATDL